ncbi:hypothetical protein RFI_32713 [Reticulomyxa filosa]|uniref:LamG-like jellyroll fold domain-containing protein n=1 Tax=Reticulomyxa filosa TaxID=46433 RepID=X6LSQ3_RETFI|nr:hypothetical protein RFI_32713 [Reticulomyxa filosa]|eukprot:ETO04684.1 hypothetical protein RFI_32713 [Reticulomyxa filosa]
MEGDSEASAASTSKTGDEKEPEHDEEKKEVDDSADHEATLAQARTVMDQIIESEENNAPEEELEMLENQYDSLMNSLPQDMREQLASEWDSTSNAERPEKSSEKSEKKTKSIPPFSPIFTDGRFLFSVEAKKPESFPALPGKENEETDANAEETENQEEQNGDADQNEAANEDVDLSAALNNVNDNSNNQWPGSLSHASSNPMDEKNRESDDKQKKKKDKKVSKVYLSIHAFDSEQKLEHCHSITLKRPPPKNEEVVLSFVPPGLFFFFFFKKRIFRCNTLSSLFLFSCSIKNNIVCLVLQKGDASEKRKKNEPASETAVTTNRWGRRTASKNRYHNTSLVDLGCPKDLNFSGSTTMECWLRFPNSETRQGPQQIFQHGDGSYSTYLYIQNQQIYCGSSTINGTSTGYASGQADLSQWTHLAVTYDVADTIWRIYVNGMLSTGHSYPTGANCMPQANGKNWTVGSIPGRPFFGQICDIRIWSCARSEDQIKKKIVTQEYLRGFWPCNDSLGLIVRDLSSLKSMAL